MREISTFERKILQPVKFVRYKISGKGLKVSWPFMPSTPNSFGYLHLGLFALCAERLRQGVWHTQMKECSPAGWVGNELLIHSTKVRIQSVMPHCKH